MELLFGFIILIFSIILHEVAHGWVADRLGDPTPRISGRLTLNPLPHIDPVMSVFLPLLLILTGSPIVFGAAKPVPIDPFNLRAGRKDLGLVGLAGPSTNLALAIGATLLFKLISFLPFLPFSYLLLFLLKTAVFYNLLLAALNLIPLPPLDGSRILGAVLPSQQARILDLLEPYGIFIVFFLLFFPIAGFSLVDLIFKLASFWMQLLGF